MRPPPAPYACGYRTGVFADTTRPNWDGTGPRPLAWSAWYPVAMPGATSLLTGHGLFDLGPVCPDQPVAGEGCWPVVLLSHGTGGSAESLGWLARRLAQQGRVVLACQHHGNTACEPYRAEGFLCWWERAQDLRHLLTLSAAQGFLQHRLDLDRVSALGYSLGAHTVLALAGAVTSMDQMLRWQAETGRVGSGPREFPDLADHLVRLLRESPVFRASWERQHEVCQDARVRTVVALAPPPPVRSLTPASVRTIERPVHLIVAGADAEAPTVVGAQWLVEVNPQFTLHCMDDAAGHHTFLGLPSAIGQRECPVLFEDAPGVDRLGVHARCADRVSLALG